MDKLDYGAFFEEYALKDTFYSWFAVTELHIWMLATRAMAEGEDGTVLRNAIVECLWIDVVERIKAFGVSTSDFKPHFLCLMISESSIFLYTKRVMVYGHNKYQNIYTFGTTTCKFQSHVNFSNC